MSLKRGVCRETEGDVSAWVLQRGSAENDGRTHFDAAACSGNADDDLDGLCRRRRDWRRADSVLSRSGYWGRTDR